MTTPANQARAIFLEAIEQPDAAQRAKFIAQACGGDVELQGRVEQLVRAHEQLGSFHLESDRASPQLWSGRPSGSVR